MHLQFHHRPRGVEATSLRLPRGVAERAPVVVIVERVVFSGNEILQFIEPSDRAPTALHSGKGVYRDGGHSRYLLATRMRPTKIEYKICG